MTNKTKELVAAGHALAKELHCAESAALVRELATQLDVQMARSNALAAENAGLKSAFDKPDAWLSWHSIPPTFYEPDRGGEYLQVHEKAGEKNDDGSDSWPVYRKPETETPATDAILAEVRASELDSLAGVAETMLVKFANQNASQIPEAKGWEMIQRQTSHRAAQLRQGGAV